MSRLSWRANNGSCAVAVAAHRAALAGLDVREQDGDYLLAGGGVERMAEAFGLVLEDRSRPLPAGPALRPPRSAVFAGEASAYPYYAYYAHCLLSLGLPYRAVDGREIAAGALDETDLLVLPGGFATWGLDRVEDAPGADRAVRAFLDRGGAAIGSCGGAFYLSAGRPNWTETANVKAKYTHEYLQTGAAIVNVRLIDDRLGRGCPPQLEIPYYHGPAFPDAGSNGQSLAAFDSFAVPSRLFIDNPLSAQRFAEDLAGRPAALFASGTAGRAVLFSPHPEMGDFLRKHIALDGYVRKYLPIRGRKVMDETLRFYAPEDSASFRLVLNAAHLLGCFSMAGAVREATTDADRRGLKDALGGLDAPLARAAQELREALMQQGDAEWRDLIEAEIERQARDWRRVRRQLDGLLEGAGAPLDALVCRETARLCRDAEASVQQLEEQPFVQQLMMAELPLRLLRAAARNFECDQILSECLEPR